MFFSFSPKCKLQALQKALEESDDKEKLVEFQRILNELKAENLITNEVNENFLFYFKIIVVNHFLRLITDLA